MERNYTTANLGPLTRRTILFGLVGLPWLERLDAQRLASPDQSAETSIVEFEWEMPRSRARQVARELGLGEKHIFASPYAEPERGPPLIVILLAAVVLIELAGEVIELYRDLRYGGMIIQANDRRLLIRHYRGMPGRMIIIHDRNGARVHELRGDVSPAQLAQALAQARSAPAR